MTYDTKVAECRGALTEVLEAVRIGAETVDALTPGQVAAVHRFGIDLTELQLAITLLELDIKLVPLKPPGAAPSRTVNKERKGP